MQGIVRLTLNNKTKMMAGRATLSRWFMYGFCLLSLFGCYASSEEEETQEYVLKIKSRKSQPIDPLPEVKLYTPFTYTANDLRSPFKKPVIEVAPPPVSAGQASGLAPDLKRAKEQLESFPLDNLAMVGVLENDEGKWALIKDSSGTVHRVTEGNYLGQNYGKIDEVKDTEVLLTELVQDPQGIWSKRQVALTLSE
jgi:type IV pilus assembly protein PilP